MTTPIDALGPPLSQQTDVTDPLAALGPKKGSQASASGNPIDLLGPARQSDPLSALSDLHVANAGPSAAPPSFAVDHPIVSAIGSAIENTVEDLASTLKFSLMSGMPASGHLKHYGMAKYNTDPTKPIVTSDYNESTSEFLTRRDAEGDPDAHEEMNRVMRGTAFLGSMLPTGLIMKATKGLLGPVMASIVSESAGGAVYGSIRPPEAGETRGQNAIDDAAVFGAFGGTMTYLGKGLVKLIDLLPQRKQIAYRAAEILKESYQEVADAGAHPASLPEAHRTAMQVAAMRQALGEWNIIEPNAIDLDQQIKTQIDRQLETTPRFDEPTVLPELEQLHENMSQMTLQELVEAKVKANVPSELIGAGTKVVDEQGVPRRVYRGLVGTVEGRENSLAPEGQPIFFAENPEHADLFAQSRGIEGDYTAPSGNNYNNGSRMVPAYLDIKKPLFLGGPGEPPAIIPETFKQHFFDEVMSHVPKGGNPVIVNGREIPYYENMEKRAKALIFNKSFDPVGLMIDGGFSADVPITEADVMNAAKKSGFDGLKFEDDVKGMTSVAWAAFSHDQVLTAKTKATALDMLRNSATSEGAAGSKIAILHDAATRAAESINFVQAGSPAVQVAKQVSEPTELAVEKSFAARLPGVAEEAPSRLRQAIDRALAQESPAAEAGLSVELSGGLRELEGEAVPGGVKGKKGSGVSGEVPGDASIETSMWSEMRAPWAESAAPDPVAGPRLTGWQLAHRMSDDALDLLEKAARKKLNESGAAPFSVLSRLALGATGSVLEYTAFNEPDDADSAMKKGTLATVGGFLIAASAYPALKLMLADKIPFTRRIIQLYNHEALIADAGSKEGLRRYRELLTAARTYGEQQSKILERTFPDKSMYRAAMLAIDEGGAAPEMLMLSPEQQQAAKGIHTFNTALGQLLKAEGIIAQPIDNYISHVLPKETYNKWLVDGWRTINTSGGLTQRRRILALRDLEQWALTNGVPAPSFELPAVQGKHIEEAYNLIANSRIQNTLKNVGTLAPLEAVLPDGWRRVGVGLGEAMMAPDAVAAALENIATKGTSQTGLLNSLDTIKSHWMQAIMFWPWEHGLNEIRAAIATAFSPAAFGSAWKAVRDMDPALVEASRYGLDPYARSDFSKQISESFEKAVQIASGNGNPALAALAKGAGAIAKWNETILWDKIVPSLRLFGYQTQMARWADMTKGAFLPGTPEYVAAARKAADFANTTTGAVPKEFQNPRFARMLRLTLFSPAWSLTRMGITASAAGELSEIAAGRLNPRDAMYLPFKMRQLAWGVAATWAISKMLTGEEPEFNENNLKFYVKTNWDNGQGRNVGVDLLGWWQDDFKFFNDPKKWAVGRLNPVITATGNVLQGRDYLGRQTTLPEQAANLFKSGGPLPAAVELGARGLQGEPMSQGELAQQLSRILATGNVATMPNSSDVVIGQMSRRMLREQHIPATDDRTYELSRILKSNMLGGRPLVNQQVVDYLAYRRRSQAAKEPLVNLWNQAQDVIAEF